MEKPTRRIARENAFIRLFSIALGGDAPDVHKDDWTPEEEYRLDAYMEALLQNCLHHQAELDAVIFPKLKGWTIERLPKVSLQLLRLATAEMLYGEEDMDSVAINEAVELAKKYGDEGDYQFINGILGNISRELHPVPQKKAPEENG